MLSAISVGMFGYCLYLTAKDKLSVTIDVQAFPFFTRSVAFGYLLVPVCLLALASQFLSAGVVAAFSMKKCAPVLPSAAFGVISSMQPCSTVEAVLFGFFLALP